jgi:lipopolysaccharide/colanic/teichoic acid biosynthesis glycosyltransferase
MAQVVYFPDIIHREAIPDGVDLEQYYLKYLLPKKLKPDLEYIEHQSLWLDLQIIARTIWCLVTKSWRLLPIKQGRSA